MPQPNHKKDDEFSKQIYYDPNRDYNVKVLTKVKDIASLASGSCCGILQLTGLNGIVLFLVENFLASAVYFYAVSGGPGKVNHFYTRPKRQIFLDNFTRYFASYVMMWCLLYALVTA